ncbi:hypothetical protein F2P81_012090 [Scophthalmus maximus]|uniref:Uncharacterized protein n=1 Tax=Scophthalmus maximus TaxID=52904 RepID=A0A6A4SXC7_SCOMX|nr:hypothetical protein F2P81_012090 [Scophthalmus maximus]
MLNEGKNHTKTYKMYKFTCSTFNFHTAVVESHDVFKLSKLKQIQTNARVAASMLQANLSAMLLSDGIKFIVMNTKTNQRMGEEIEETVKLLPIMFSRNLENPSYQNIPLLLIAVTVFVAVEGYIMAKHRYFNLQYMEHPGLKYLKEFAAVTLKQKNIVF